jgi:uncharacterized Zn finger protein
MDEIGLLLWKGLLQSRIGLDCPLCGKDDPEFGKERFHFDTTSEGTDEDVFVLICRNCGFVRRHSMRILER